MEEEEENDIFTKKKSDSRLDFLVKPLLALVLKATHIYL